MERLRRSTHQHQEEATEVMLLEQRLVLEDLVEVPAVLVAVIAAMPSTDVMEYDLSWVMVIRSTFMGPEEAVELVGTTILDLDTVPAA